MRKVATIIIISIFVFSLYPTIKVYAQPNVSATSAILIEASTGEIVYAKNEHEQRAMASITKIMTTLLTIESGDLDTPFIVDSQAIKVEGSSMGLQEGDTVTKRVLCYGMMLPSGNDAANTAAYAVAGSVPEFAKLMNAKAKEIGMTSTNFVTPSGLDANGHYTTAYDMVMLARYALANPEFKEICSTKEKKLEYGNPPYTRWLYNGNKMLNSYKGCIGVKTGFTDNAKRTLVSAVERDGITLIAVTLNDPNDWHDHTTMFDYGYSVIKNQTLKYDYKSLMCDVVGGVSDRIEIAPSNTPKAGLTEKQLSKVTTRVHLEQFVYAPVNVGDVVGSVEFLVDGNVVATTSLLAAQSVDAYILEVKPGFFESIGNFISGIIDGIKNIFS